MNAKGESSIVVGNIIINKEKGEWKKPNATDKSDASNTTANSITA